MYTRTYVKTGCLVDWLMSGAIVISGVYLTRLPDVDALVWAAWFTAVGVGVIASAGGSILSISKHEPSTDESKSWEFGRRDETPD